MAVVSFARSILGQSTQETAPSEGDEEAQEVLEEEESLTPWFEGPKEDDWQEETWKTCTDSKPKGMLDKIHVPTSTNCHSDPKPLSIDTEFPSIGLLYGFPQHVTYSSTPTK